MEKYYRQFDTCRQNEKPFCSSACPFHVDVLDFQTKMLNNNYNAAFRTFRNAVGFPDIVAALCPEYCASVCPRGELDQPVQLNLLERTCVAKATKKDPTDYNVPLKDRKIAIIGAGISGLACAVRLTQKKYNVTIYEKSGRLGGKLWDLLPSDIFRKDIERQFQFEKYTLNYNAEIKSIDEIRSLGFEAIYAATGKDGFDFGAMDQANGFCILDGGIALFAGGSLTGKDPMHALADGLDMAWAIEVFLKTGRLEYPEGEKPCKAKADPDKLQKKDAVIPTENGVFTDEEATAEAGRCIRCQCDACMKYCDVCSFHNKWPMKIRDDVMSTVAFSTSESMMKKTPAKRLMSTCTQCGLCDEVCPEDIEIGGMLLEARRSLHKQDTLPGAYHQFWIRDMEFTNSEFAAVAQKAPGQERCAYAFFPGCQLGAADPRYVKEPYQWLLSKKPDTGLILRCCGVPAEWAGNEEKHESVIDDLHRNWEQLGKPILILACPACRKHLKEYLPEIETISLYEVLDQWGSPWKAVMQGEVYSIFDPCTARHIEPLEQAVRNLTRQAGLSPEELPGGDMHGCCGYGGNGSVANSDYYDYVAKSRSELSENPYLVYCINCRDVFLGEGKPVLHILDLLFDINREDSKLPSLTQRRQNRIDLKETLLNEIWGEKMEKKPDKCKYNLKIGAGVLDRMDELKIIEEDVCNVIELSETSKRRTFDPQNGTYTGYRESGHITYWVEYRQKEEEYEVVNVYTHRMKIKLEGVWNGRKTNIDL
ncbi:MAG TPA: FAD-dependent oxidoreductase [Anaerovoracaceae bacterium]|nr:FAD-dependent oxidoreductase [Anaerovoracaceae bacterium]